MCRLPVFPHHFPVTVLLSALFLFQSRSPFHFLCSLPVKRCFRIPQMFLTLYQNWIPVLLSFLSPLSALFPYWILSAQQILYFFLYRSQVPDFLLSVRLFPPAVFHLPFLFPADFVLARFFPSLSESRYFVP